MQLFAALRKIREFERLQLPFVRSLIDFDIIIAIGYAQEQKQPLMTKQLFLLELSSLTTVRRRLTKLIEKGVVRQRSSARDRRSVFLDISHASQKLIGKYGNMLTSICAEL